MSGPITGQKTGLSEHGNMDDSQVPSKTDLRDGPEIVGPSSEELADIGEQRIQEDTSTLVSLSENAVQSSPGSSTSTTTRQPADEAAIEARRDQDRLLALQLLDLEWTSLPPELQHAVVVLLHDVTKGR